jgi:hypothetical protein
MNLRRHQTSCFGTVVNSSARLISTTRHLNHLIICCRILCENSCYSSFERIEYLAFHAHHYTGMSGLINAKPLFVMPANRHLPMPGYTLRKEPVSFTAILFPEELRSLLQILCGDDLDSVCVKVCNFELHCELVYARGVFFATIEPLYLAEACDCFSARSLSRPSSTSCSMRALLFVEKPGATHLPSFQTSHGRRGLFVAVSFTSYPILILMILAHVRGKIYHNICTGRYQRPTHCAPCLQGPYTPGIAYAASSLVVLLEGIVSKINHHRLVT